MPPSSFDPTSLFEHGELTVITGKPTYHDIQLLKQQLVANAVSVPSTGGNGKAMAMRFFWVQDRTDQRHFRIYWDKGICNLADYFTKHHPPSHHRAVRPTYHPAPSTQDATNAS